MEESQPVRKILVADDEEVTRDLFKRLIPRLGHEIYTASNGQEALEMIRENNFDLLIMDLKMPVMDGMELLDRIHQLGKEIPTVVITGYATMEITKQALEAGCIDLVIKPFSLEDIQRAIKKALRYPKNKDKRSPQFKSPT